MNSKVASWLTILFIAGCSGSGLELIFSEHYEDFWQWVPLLLLSLGIVAATGFLLINTPLWSRLFGSTALLMCLSGLLGIYFHLKGNVEFELEMNPNISGLDLVWETLTGAFPSLAPSAMIFLGLIGLIVVSQTDQ